MKQPTRMPATCESQGERESFAIFDMPYVLLVMAILFWSGNFVLGRAVRAEVPPVALAFWRWTGATLLVSCLARPHLKRDWQTVRRHWGILTLLAVLGVASFNTLVYWGLHWTIALNAFLIQSTMPLVIVVMSFLIFRERISMRQAAGVLISLSGVFAIIVKGDMGLLRSLTVNRGDILVLIAVVCYAGYSVMLRKRPPIHPLSFIIVTFTLGSLMLLPLYLWEIFSGRVIRFNAPTLLAVCYVSVFPSIVSYICYNRGVELAGANRAGVFYHLMPVFGSIMAILFLGEVFRWFHGVGIALIASGILLATREKGR